VWLASFSMLLVSIREKSQRSVPHDSELIV
jgi:hypothetical protein